MIGNRSFSNGLNLLDRKDDHSRLQHNAEQKINHQNSTEAFVPEIEQIKMDSAKQRKRVQILQDMDFFVLDNSIRESTVGQLRGHTLENKNLQRSKEVWLHQYCCCSIFAHDSSR